MNEETDVHFVDVEDMDHVCGAVTTCLESLNMETGDVHHSIRLHLIAHPGYAEDGVLREEVKRDLLMSQEGAAYLAADIVREGQKIGEEFIEQFEHFLRCERDECWLHGGQYDDDDGLTGV